MYNKNGKLESMSEFIGRFDFDFFKEFVITEGVAVTFEEFECIDQVLMVELKQVVQVYLKNCLLYACPKEEE